MNYRKIDMDKYPRKKHFEFFKSMEYPHVGATIEIDVTDLVSFCKENKYSFYLTFMHVVALAADKVKEFRQRILNGEIIEYDHCYTSHTEALEDETYCFCNLRHNLNFKEYMKYALEERALSIQRRTIEEDPNDVLNYYFISTVPWFSYTDLIQPTNGYSDSNPRFTWGKYKKDYNNRLQLPLTILAHHALIDGIHIGKFINQLEIEIKKLINE